MTGSSCLGFIGPGENLNFCPLISITFGLSLARVRLITAGTPTSPISHTPASRMIPTILLIVVFFIFLLVLCVSVSVFEHLIHSDRARVFGGRELDFLDLQIAAIRIAVDPPDAQVLERLSLVEGRRLLRGRRRGIREGED